MRPRIRTVKPEMRQDERYARLSYPARELFNGLITMADDEGRFRALVSQITGHVFPYDVERDPELGRRVREWVAEIKDSGMILFYIVEGTPYGAFRHWAKHQQINRPTPSDLPPPPSPKVVKENSLVETPKGWKQFSRIPHGELTENSVSPPSPRGSDPDPVVIELSERLAARVRENDPQAKPSPESQRWLTDMRLLLADRGGDAAAAAEIRKVIDWCQADGFWRSNILSPGKLRKQFTALVLRAKGGPGGGSVVPLRPDGPDGGGGRFAHFDRAAGL